MAIFFYKFYNDVHQINTGGIIMAINYIYLGERIKAARQKKGLTQLHLAELLNCSSPYLSYVESGTKCVSLELLVEIANVLNVSADDLLLDSLSSTTAVYNHKFTNLVSDCSDYEVRILMDLATSAKQSLRTNQRYNKYRTK